MNTWMHWNKISGSRFVDDDEQAMSSLDRAEEQLKERRKELDERFEDKKRKLETGDDLAPGVLEDC